jgi:hypothetical protein
MPIQNARFNSIHLLENISSPMTLRTLKLKSLGKPFDVWIKETPSNDLLDLWKRLRCVQDLKMTFHILQQIATTNDAPLQATIQKYHTFFNTVW